MDEDAIICTKRDQVILRIGASKSYREIDRFPPGTILSVIEGPVCADSWSWWKVRVKGLEGWMSEGGDQIDAYFLCPN